MNKKQYIPKPVDTSAVVLSADLQELTEAMARNVHDVWAAKRIAQGWQWGLERDDKQKFHPCLVPYEELPESEREFDRCTALRTLKLIQTLGYEIKKHFDESTRFCLTSE